MTLLAIPFTWIDAIDILLVAILMYQVYQIVKGTVAIRIFIGVFAIYLFWQIVEALKMEMLAEILGQFISVGVIALIIVFQQELRRFLLLIGTTGFKNVPLAKRFFKWNENLEEKTDPAPIADACLQMAESKTGALIVLTKTDDLNLLNISGDRIDANLNGRLLQNIFFKNSPMHDGAVIIHSNTIVACNCVLPVSEKANFPKHLGLRHRAGVGITETTDSMTIIVSEQTGEISVAQNGTLDEKINKETLFQRIKSF